MRTAGCVTWGGNVMTGTLAKTNPPGRRKLAPTAAVPQPMDQATISTKRRMEPDSDSSSESPSPVAKSSKSNKTPLALSSPRSVCSRVVRDILCQLAHAHDVSLVMSFVWMPSHIGLAGNDMADGLAKAACVLDVGDMAAEPSLRCQRNTIYSAGFAMTGQTLVQICKYLLSDDNLEVILTRHPNFGGC
ncbi:hypothetical protein Pcinc_042270 [Petrolisthes cinctipes]|uniref:RNase H type-1 domain-containing protein n=1 Tax=Petrolisthes cinctipes TaxID=88211 RepID=A0AAE1BI69_PETCI|nr:hypothetical protein Pcinc_042270 [Petrolisthes cinctipes]